MVTRCSANDDYTSIRLSKHFLLSDFMGCNSVYAHGKSNIFVGGEQALAEARNLCETLLEPLLEYGSLSVSYGYLSPLLSRCTVRYQDPDKPSYHRWDDGAAADVCLHSVCAEEGLSPVMMAHVLDELGKDFPYSRMITYSESPYVCLAAKLVEAGTPGRRAFYENRYQGKRGAPPLFIRKSKRPETRAKQLLDAQSTAYTWVGDGYPTYHGGGGPKLHHRRASQNSMVSDFLYSKSAIDLPVANFPDLSVLLPAFLQAGEVYDHIIHVLDVPRMSVAVGYQSRLLQYSKVFGWEDGVFAIEFIPPAGTSLDDVASVASELDCVEYSYVTVYDTVYVRGQW